MSNESVATLSWSLDVECPACKQDNDLSTSPHDDDHEFGRAIFSNEWDALNGYEVTCQHCQHEFKIEKVEI